MNKPSVLIRQSDQPQESAVPPPLPAEWPLLALRVKSSVPGKSRAQSPSHPMDRRDTSC